MFDIEKYKKTGDFELSSGKKSKFYYDIKEALGEPENLRDITRELDKKHNMKNIDVIIGIDYGGIPMAVALSLYVDIPFAILRKEKKNHGTMKRIEGYQKVGRALLLDDVTTTGGSLKEAKTYLKSLGYEIMATDVALHRNG